MCNQIAKEDDIIRAFNEEILSKKETTTLDVKNNLRSKDFWVEQKTVSEVLAKYATNYSKTYINRHKIYRLEQNSQESKKYFVTDGINPSEIISNMTRNQARYTYAKQYNVLYKDVKARVY